MFSLGSTGASFSSAKADPANLLVIPPSAVGTLDSAAIEDVLLLRDELADMAWGVERTAVGPSGIPIDRARAWKIAAPPMQPPSGTGIPMYTWARQCPTTGYPSFP